METVKNVDSAKVVKHLLQEIEARYVLDCTYGLGGFYKYYKPKLLVGVDPNIYDKYIVKPDILIPKPIWAITRILEMLNIGFDTCVIDPPFKKIPRGDRRQYYFNLVGSPNLILREGIKLCSRLHISNLIIHYSKIIDPSPYRIEKIIEYLYSGGYLKMHSYFILARLDG